MRGALRRSSMQIYKHFDFPQNLSLILSEKPEIFPPMRRAAALRRSIFFRAEGLRFSNFSYLYLLKAGPEPPAASH